jgi:hypothetical protein
VEHNTSDRLAALHDDYACEINFAVAEDDYARVARLAQDFDRAALALMREVA